MRITHAALAAICAGLVLAVSAGAGPPPVPYITSSPSNPTTQTSASFSFDWADSLLYPPVWTSQCKLDAAAYGPCTTLTTQTYSGLSVGSHTFSVRTKKVSGNQASQPATFTWTITQPGGFPIPTWQVDSTATAGESNPEAFQSWLYYEYPHMPSPIAWSGGPRLVDFWTPQADAVQGSWEWWYLYEIFIPTNWDQATEGTMNALQLDAHNKPDDVGWIFEEGCASGVSSIHTRYMNGNLVLQHERQQDDNTGPHEFVIQNITKGVWHSVAYQFILGRLDGTIPAAGHPNGGKGRTRVWVDGAQALDTGDINILQRDRCTGQVQKKMSLLQGLYNGDMTAPHMARFTVARAGRTLSEALAHNTFNFQMVFYNPSGLDGNGNPRFHTWTQLPPRSSSDFISP